MLRNTLSLKSCKRYLKQITPLQSSLNSSIPQLSVLSLSTYVDRHIGPQRGNGDDINKMLKTVGFKSVDELIENTIPSHIRLDPDEIADMKSVLGPGMEENDALAELKNKLSSNIVNKTYIGMGYYDTLTPTPILRNMIENPSWYTPYTPYQAEIAQGRLEMLLNFQTMIQSIVGKEISNASLLDESTACAEAMSMCLDLTNKTFKKDISPIILVSDKCHPQNIAVLQTRAEPMNITVNVLNDIEFKKELENKADNNIFAALTQYPDTYGSILDNLESLTASAHSNNILMITSTDLMACSLLKPPGDCGVDIVVGTSQRFGVPLGYGGPHAGFLSTDLENRRKMPGRFIGVSHDSRNKPALRMSLQTREQHIRRDKATSNICTAQALLANVSAAYGIYHGPEGIKNIAKQIHNNCCILESGLTKHLKCCSILNKNGNYFDTLTLKIDRTVISDANIIINNGYLAGINFRPIDDDHLSISIDETTSLNDINNIFNVFINSMNNKSIKQINISALKPTSSGIPSSLNRSSSFMDHETFHLYHSETAFMRYLYDLERKDLGLNTAMIPLGSCTMKLNSASVMIPLTWRENNGIHPFVPLDQTKGYKSMIDDVESWLCSVTGFDAVSLQPNSGANGEYTGLLCIREYHVQNNDYPRRNICLIPVSAHGTNPASAAMVGFKVVGVKCTSGGDVDMCDLKRLADKHSDNLSCIMVTYPSTHGVFEDDIRELCDIIHSAGGLVYMDGANLQAQLTKTSPASIGADVAHLNLHKTFCIPHGGGGPGLGPIGVNNKLAKYLPSHPIIPTNHATTAIGPIASAPWSSASILSISWMYIRMMGYDGLESATNQAILSANYMVKRLNSYYKIMYLRNNLCAHEFIIDLRNYYEKDAKYDAKNIDINNDQVDPKYIYKIGAEDVAKRLMDYSFHAPTMSWPVTNTLMVEPTESEPLYELDRFCDAMIQIKHEINEIELGAVNINKSALRNSPHTIDTVIDDNWSREYTRKHAAINPEKPYWPSVGRINNAFGDKHIVCTCPTVQELQELQENAEKENEEQLK